MVLSTLAMAITMLIISFMVLLSMPCTKGDANNVIARLTRKHNELADSLIELQNIVQGIHHTTEILENEVSEIRQLYTDFVKKAEVQQLKSELNVTKNQVMNKVSKVEQQLYRQFVKKVKVQQLKSELNVTKYKLRSQISQNTEKLKNILNANCENFFQGCEKCDSLQSEGEDIFVCTQCKLGMYLENNKCFVCGNLTHRCEKYDSLQCEGKELVCTECQPGMYLENNTCIVCGNLTHRCEKYDSLQCEGKELVCTECQPGMYLENNTCTVDYAALQYNSYREVQRVQVGDAWRLRGEGSELWLTLLNDDTLYVYTQTLTLLRSVTLEGVGLARAVVPTQTGQLMVASSRGLRLHHTNGSHVQTLQTGVFDDVVIQEDMLYGLKFEFTPPSHVYMYQSEAGQWVRNSSVTLEYKYAKRLTVYNHTLYVKYMNRNSPYHYTMTGQRLSVYGEYGSDVRGTRPGVWNNPHICHTDTAGNVLVADEGNQRLQVYSPHTGEWSLVSLTENTGRTKDAVVGEDGQTIWVLEENPDDWTNYIVKYNKQ